MSREIVFYSDFPVGFHNTEAEEKMARFARRGYRVRYVEQLGLRNPGARDAARLARRLGNGRKGTPDRHGPFEVLSPKLLLPRRAPLIDRLNRAWLARQLLEGLRAPQEAILWIRFPTPELVAVAESRRPRLIVYEAVDDHVGAPGLSHRLRTILTEAETRILVRAAVVFAWSEPIRDRLALRHPNVWLAPAAVDAAAFVAATAPAGADHVAVYAGALDRRFDTALMAEVADRLPAWRFELAGPLDGAARRVLAGRQNVRLHGRLPPERVPALLAGSSVCLMPYRLDAFSENLFPIKLVEYLAAGRPVASVPIRATRAFTDVIELGDGPESFVMAIERAAKDDGPEDRARRVDRVRSYSWDRRIDEMEHAIQMALNDG